MGDRAAREMTPLPIETSENLNSCSIAQAQFDTAAQYVDIPEHWSEDQVNAHLRTKKEAATDAVLQTKIEIQERHAASVDLRTAAFVTAIKRVATVALARGIWP